jgi:hypothetical protein
VCPFGPGLERLLPADHREQNLIVHHGICDAPPICEPERAAKQAEVVLAFIT